MQNKYIKFIGSFIFLVIIFTIDLIFEDDFFSNNHKLV